jgi:imidazolonepropionase
MTTLFRNIGELFTNDPAWGDRFGILLDAAVEFDAGVITWVGRDSDSDGHSRNASEVIDCAGHAVIPGFVDSHTHALFAGDRSAEFEARMKGEPYSAGGINSTVLATRSASDAELRDGLNARLEEMRVQGTSTVEIKTGYGLTVEHETRFARIAREFTEDVTFLGAHVVPTDFSGSVDDYVDLVCGEMLDAVSPHAKWIDVFCEEGAFSEEQSARVLDAGMRAGLLPRIHGAQLGPSGAVGLAVERGALSIDHGTFLTDSDIDLLAGSTTGVTLLPGAEFSTRQPFPDGRRLIDAGISVSIATNCNPGSSFTSSMAFCIALAVREMGMTTAEALWAATAGGARALGRDDVGRIAVGARAHLVELAAPNHVHLAYRPGVNLVHRTTF